MSESIDRVTVRALTGHADSENGMWRAEGAEFTMSAARAELKAREGFVSLVEATPPAPAERVAAQPEAPAPQPAPAPAPSKPTVHRRKRDTAA